MEFNIARTEKRSWWDLYSAAMIELELNELGAKIEAARAAILLHMKEPTSDSRECIAVEERRAMSDALENLRALHKIEFGSPARRGPVRETAAGSEARP